MSRYEYDVDQELDDSLGYPTLVQAAKSLRRAEQKAKKSISLEMETKGPRIAVEQMMLDMMDEKRRAEDRLRKTHELMGNQVVQWSLSLGDGAPVVGKMVVPGDLYIADDRLLMTVFDKLFGSVHVEYLGGTRFHAKIEGRLLGKFQLDDRVAYGKTAGRVDQWGMPMYTPEVSRKGSYEHMEREAYVYLRKNLALKLDTTPEVHPPYRPKLPKGKKLDVENSLQTWTGHSHVREEEKPYADAVRMDKFGVNLSRTSGGGATNLAFSTQLQKTSIAGVRMDQEGVVIG